MLQREYNSALRVLTDKIKTIGAVAFADELGIHNVHVYHAWNSNHFSKTLEQAMRRAGHLEQRKTRVRLAADVTEEQRERLQEMVEPLTWSEFCRDLADGKYWPIEPI